MDIKIELENRIHEMEQVAKLFNIEPFVDLEYSSYLGKVFVHLRDFDMLEYESTILSPKFKERAIKLEKFKYLNIYILSIEDIIVSKIIRLEQKDIQDIDELIKIADIERIEIIIIEVLERQDLYDSKKSEFIRKLPLFRERYYV